jgi:hypothetical protein
LANKTLQRMDTIDFILNKGGRESVFGMYSKRFFTFLNVNLNVVPCP